MDVHKIKSKYCTDEKVQVMFSNADNQIICSKDGYLYLRDGDITIHRYLTDPLRDKMPYKNKPSSNIHANHLLKYEQFYAKFTKSRNMRFGFDLNGSYSFTFLYFIRRNKKEAICAEIGLREFDSEEEELKNLSLIEVEEFLYNAEGLNGKYVFDWFRGIEYIKCNKEQVSIDKHFIDFSDEAIIEKYNKEKYPDPWFLFGSAERQKKELEAKRVKSIDKVEKVTLTRKGEFFNHSTPISLVVKDNEMYVYEFEIIYCSKDCFNIKSIKRKICMTQNLRNKILLEKSADYTVDPYFSE